MFEMTLLYIYSMANSTKVALFMICVVPTMASQGSYVALWERITAEWGTQSICIERQSSQTQIATTQPGTEWDNEQIGGLPWSASNTEVCHTALVLPSDNRGQTYLPGDKMAG